MIQHLKCIVKECENRASGLVCVNMQDPEITVFMIPSCTDHAEVMKTQPFQIRMELNVPPEVQLLEPTHLDWPRPDVTLSFQAF